MRDINTKNGNYKFDYDVREKTLRLVRMIDDKRASIQDFKFDGIYEDLIEWVKTHADDLDYS